MRLGLALLALLQAGSVRAQDELPDWKLDPYTRNEQAAVQAAGYVRLGTLGMPWGDGDGARAVEEALGDVKIRWVETEHFRIGSSLPECRVTHVDRERVAGELERLAKGLPGVRPQVRELDPWLRLHLYAWRLEGLHAEFSALAGAEQPGLEPRASSRGSSRIAAGRGKHRLLLTELRTTLSRYAERFEGVRSRQPLRITFGEQGSFFFGSSIEFFDGDSGHDTAFYCHVAWNIVQNLVEAEVGQYGRTPRWWADGLAHVFTRAIDPRYPSVSELVEPIEYAIEQWNWAPKVRARVKQGVWPRADEMLTWPTVGPRSLAENMMMWSRVDYLVQQHPQGVVPFMEALRSAPGVSTTLTPEEQADLQRDALREAWRVDPLGFDAAWVDWVLETYPRR